MTKREANQQQRLNITADQTAAVENCAWASADFGLWITACGEMHSIVDGTPAENRMRFCCFCGRHIFAA